MYKKEFLDYLRVEKRYSQRTIVSYQTDLNQFSSYLESCFEITEINTVSHVMIRSWIVELIERVISTKTVNRKIATLNTYFKYLLRMEIVTSNPMLKITAPKMSKKLPVFVEEEAMINLLEELEFPDNFNGELDRLILELFYSTGIRLSELINIKAVDVSNYGSTIKVLGKRNKERIIPIGKSLLILINNYIREKIKLNLLQSEFLLQDEKGKKLYEKKVYRIVNKLTA